MRAAAVLLLASPLLAQGARSLLEAYPERSVREGIRICVEENSLKSTRLLLDVLRRRDPDSSRPLAPGHYRDMVWDGLIRIANPEARARVARLARSDKNPWVRQWCVELLGIWNATEHAGVLVSACADKRKEVRRWAARSLGLLRHAGGARALQKLAREKDPYIRANAIESLMQIDPKAHRDRFLRALKRDPDGGVRCALLGALPGVALDEVVALSRAALKDKDWRPRMQAVDNLDRPQKKAVDGLIEALGDGRPVVVARAMKVLRKLTGKEIHDPATWKAWWAANREKFRFPEEGDEPERGDNRERKTVAFNDIPLVSDHVAFLIDKSYPMKMTLQSRNRTKDAAAHTELRRVLGKLHGRLVFNVYCYREDVQVFSKKPVKLDAKKEKRALAFVGRQKNKGKKDIWKVLEMVVSDPDIDTAYLLSSGEPDTGLYVHHNRVTRHLRDLNRFHKVVIHCVVYSERKWYRDQLEKIAQATGGDFKWFK